MSSTFTGIPVGTKPPRPKNAITTFNCLHLPIQTKIKDRRTLGFITQRGRSTTSVYLTQTAINWPVLAKPRVPPYCSHTRPNICNGPMKVTSLEEIGTRHQGQGLQERENLPESGHSSKSRCSISFF